MEQFDVVVIGAGASGLMCAATAGYRGRSVLVLEHTNKIGRKILMAGADAAISPTSTTLRQTSFRKTPTSVNRR